jgi:hypothetical protein
MIDKQRRGIQKVAGLPSLSKKAVESPLYKSRARTPKKGTRTPVSENPQKALHIESPAWLPIKTGKIRFPDPKNIENSANPVEMIMVFNFIVALILQELGAREQAIWPVEPTRSEKRPKKTHCQRFKSYFFSAPESRLV